MEYTCSSLQQRYDHNADGYSQFITTPLGTLEEQLFDLCITNCTDQHILDLGSGTGNRARDALKAGARSVDVIDLSPEMMRQGQEYEKSISRNRITWYQADVSKPLDHLGPLGPYDMVIANGIFDHAHNVEELEAMWRNAAAYLKPKGRVITNRNNPMAKAAVDGKQGGGTTFKYRIKTEPPLLFDSIALDGYAGGEMDVPSKFFEAFTNVEWGETPVVKTDLDFWREYLDDPILYIFEGRKKL